MIQNFFNKIFRTKPRLSSSVPSENSSVQGRNRRIQKIEIKHEQPTVVPYAMRQERERAKNNKANPHQAKQHTPPKANNNNDTDTLQKQTSSKRPPHLPPAPSTSSLLPAWNKFTAADQKIDDNISSHIYNMSKALLNLNELIKSNPTMYRKLADSNFGFLRDTRKEYFNAIKKYLRKKNSFNNIKLKNSIDHFYEDSLQKLESLKLYYDKNIKNNKQVASHIKQSYDSLIKEWDQQLQELSITQTNSSK
jgi:hypothetical protein